MDRPCEEEMADAENGFWVTIYLQTHSVEAKKRNCSASRVLEKDELRSILSERTWEVAAVEMGDSLVRCLLDQMGGDIRRPT